MKIENLLNAFFHSDSIEEKYEIINFIYKKYGYQIDMERSIGILKCHLDAFKTFNKKRYYKLIMSIIPK